MKSLVIALALSAAVVAPAANAYCTGGGSITNCYDANTGNSYNTNRVGNTSYTNGYNTQTGSNWSQTSTRVGNTTYINGIRADGSTWNETCNSWGCN